jgi:hypothetical protein
VGLLNIGSEELKGNDVVKRAGELLRASTLNFHGNVEGDDIYKGRPTSWSATGSPGNIALKASEGVAKMIGDFLREEYTRNLFSRFAAFVSFPSSAASAAAWTIAATTAPRCWAEGHRREEPRVRGPAGLPARAAARGHRGAQRPPRAIGAQIGRMHAEGALAGAPA